MFKIHDIGKLKTCICWPHRPVRRAGCSCPNRPMNWGQDFLLTGDYLSPNNASTARDVSNMSFFVWLHAFLVTGVRGLYYLFIQNFGFNPSMSASVHCTNL